MSLATHTPSPWSVSIDCDETGDHSHVYVLHEARGCDEERAEANRQLIEAAPKLLAALQHLLVDAEDRGETHDDETGEEYDDWKQARIAITLATGSIEDVAAAKEEAP
jgi:hypothetical protein